MNKHSDRVAWSWAIAGVSRTHAAACQEIVARGIAEDAAEAEALLYEGETVSAYLNFAPSSPLPPRKNEVQ